MSINVVSKIDDWVPVRRVLISVSDKSGLETFIPRLKEIVPDVQILSTGGTYNRIGEILGDESQTGLMPVSTYTGQPETQGGLVKTLDFKIYLGLLTETYNESHAADLKRTGAAPIDMVVVNLYPFQQTISREGITPENARGNIDIGGPCMIRASAKNYIRVASVVDPSDYDLLLAQLGANQGQTSLELRFQLAQKAFAHTAAYDQAIGEYLHGTPFQQVKQCYP